MSDLDYYAQCKANDIRRVRRLEAMHQRFSECMISQLSIEAAGYVHGILNPHDQTDEYLDMCLDELEQVLGVS